jgi:hypothetical protein
MGGTLLRAFRSRDGRSLGRALAILYLVGAVIAAFGNGASAAMATGGGVFCVTAPDGKTPAPPVSGSHTEDCCLTGHAPTPAATPGVPAELPSRTIIAAIAPIETASDLPARRHTGAASPRGPPLDA